MQVYAQGENTRAGFNSPTALAMWQLDHFDMVWEKSLDTKAIVGWNHNTVVLAFRGTASMTNVMADLQVWRARHPPGLGTPLLWTAPMVHRGFLAAYTRNGFNTRLLKLVEHLVNRCQEAQKDEGGGEVQVGVKPCTNKPIAKYFTQQGCDCGQRAPATRENQQRALGCANLHCARLDHCLATGVRHRALYGRRSGGAVRF